MRNYQIANVPMPTYGALFVAAFALMSPWNVAVRLPSAAAIVVAVGLVAKLLQAIWPLRCRNAPTLTEARAAADCRAVATGRAPRPSDDGRFSAV